MITREQFLSCIDDEFRLCNHLFSKLPEGSLSYRPTPGQRSTEELLRYLGHIGIASMDAMITGNWEGYRRYAEESKSWAIEEFPEVMNRQLEQISELFNSISPEDLASKVVSMPTGVQATLGHALLKTTLEWLVAYRMQLFLYAKGAGAAELTTSNCWMGADRKPPVKKDSVETDEKRA